METKQRHPVNLKQYRKVGGKWQFVPVARDPNGNPDLTTGSRSSEAIAASRDMAALYLHQNLHREGVVGPNRPKFRRLAVAIQGSPTTLKRIYVYMTGV
jgi:hypothetical protein